MSGPLVVAKARGWLGTPYRHQASVKGVGCDCLGLLRGVWREIYGAEPCDIPAYSRDWDEVSKDDVLRCAAQRHLVETKAAKIQDGDVILFRMRRGAVAKHLGVVSGASTFIHAYSGHGVVESALTNAWLRRIDGVFTFPARN